MAVAHTEKVNDSRKFDGAYDDSDEGHDDIDNSFGSNKVDEDAEEIEETYEKDNPNPGHVKEYEKYKLKRNKPDLDEAEWWD